MGLIEEATARLQRTPLSELNTLKSLGKKFVKYQVGAVPAGGKPVTAVVPLQWVIEAKHLDEAGFPDAYKGFVSDWISGWGQGPVKPRTGLSGATGVK